MAKLAVIFFLFALCAVAMSARIAREEPTKKPFEDIQGPFNNLVESFKAAVNNPDFKKTLEDFSKQLQDAGNKLTAGFQTKPSA